jgi:hypothetical protein
LIEYPLFPQDVCHDQWWPIEDDDYSDTCLDQWWPYGAPEAMRWDRLGSNPVADIISWLTAQAGIYVIRSDHKPKTSDHNALGWEPRLPAILDEFMKFPDPTVETEQTKADILAWKKKRGFGPSTEKFTKRGKKKK